MLLSKEQWPGLPKWPMAFVTGKSVTVEQAKEIIFRTVTSLSSPSEYGFGNDRAFRERCINVFGWRPLVALTNKWYQMTEDERKAWADKHDLPSPWVLNQAWADKMGYVSTSYVNNSWLASAYIGGPHGWCSPQGNIHSDGHNYGKWPSVDEIVADWETLLAAFPFIDLACTMYSGEQCEEDSVPVCTIKVDASNGVQVHAPDLSMHDRNPTKGGADRIDTLLFSLMSGKHDREHGWPAGWVEEYGVRSTAAMKEIAPFLF